MRFMHWLALMGVGVIGLTSIDVIAAEANSAAVTSLRVQLPQNAKPVQKNIARIFADQVGRRCNAKVVIEGESPLTVELAIDHRIGTEGYKIVDGPAETICIAGNDDLGLLYGVGKFLRTSRYDQGGFTPSSWRGTSTPQCSFRTIYAATHFMNFYEAAPIDEVREYIEELGLWGANAVVVGFPTWQFQSFDDPAAKKNLKQLRDIFHAARNVGMKVGLALCPNQGLAAAPQSTRFKPFPDDLHRRGNLGVNCCASSPEGHAYLMELYGRLFDEFKDIGLDLMVCWPYDEGGCGCEECWPWGAKGFPRMSHDLATLARKNNPQLQLVLSTWVYDTPPADEWAGLSKLLESDNHWANYIMADAHEDFPRYPLDQGVPGKLPLVNFPEISMWGRGPWGVYGVNPLPNRLDRLWKQTQNKLDGGMPYSEGIYEDINKTICMQFYWCKQPAEQTLKEYIAYEYSPEAVDELVKAAHLLEETWTDIGPKSQEAYDLAVQAEKKMTQQAKQAWRWRLFYLRTVIDLEKYKHGGKLAGPTVQQAFDELRKIYHADHVHPYLQFPSVE
jgi:hypothetical protein